MSEFFLWGGESSPNVYGIKVAGSVLVWYIIQGALTNHFPNLVKHKTLSSDGDHCPFHVLPYKWFTTLKSQTHFLLFVLFTILLFFFFWQISHFKFDKTFHEIFQSQKHDQGISYLLFACTFVSTSNIYMEHNSSPHSNLNAKKTHIKCLQWLIEMTIHNKWYPLCIISFFVSVFRILAISIIYKCKSCIFALNILQMFEKYVHRKSYLFTCCQTLWLKQKMWHLTMTQHL